MKSDKSYALYIKQHIVFISSKYKSYFIWLTEGVHLDDDDLRFYGGFLTVFQSYQYNVWMIMKGCMQWNSANS